jgi:hypothetical protein
MTITYEELDNGTSQKFIRRFNEDGSYSDIPTDLGNSDYQRYLAWLENPEAEDFTPSVINEA